MIHQTVFVFKRCERARVRPFGWPDKLVYVLFDNQILKYLFAKHQKQVNIGVECLCYVGGV